MAAALRIFSYLPNPRVAKATIVARLCGVDVEVRGAPASELGGWLWDFDAHPMDAAERAALSHLVVAPKTGFANALFKTEAFLLAHPFGTVPAAFSPDGRVGIFESNSILRTVARLGAGNRPLYGADCYEASRIDSFLDAGLIFGRETQAYVLGLAGGKVGKLQYDVARGAVAAYLGGIERALSSHAFIAGDALSIADVAFVCELALLQNERNFDEVLAALECEPLLQALGPPVHPRALGHFDRLVAEPAFAVDLSGYLRAPPLGRPVG